MKHVRLALVALSVLPVAAGVLAQDQDKPAPAKSPASPTPLATPAEARPPRPDMGLVPLKVQVVFAKYDGEKKVSSLPYSFIVTAGDRRGTQLRMGIEVPVPVTFVAAPAGSAGLPPPATSFQYRNVGTSVDCTAEIVGEGRYKLIISVEQASIYSAPERRSSPSSVVQGPLADAPMFRTYKSSFNAVVRDGQSSQFTAATDPVTGEVTKVDITVNVVR